MEKLNIYLSVNLIEEHQSDFEFAILFRNENGQHVYQSINCDYSELKEDETDVYEFMDNLLLYLKDNREMNELLTSYTNWEDFDTDFMNTNYQVVINAFADFMKKRQKN